MSARNYQRIAFFGSKFTMQLRYNLASVEDGYFANRLRAFPIVRTPLPVNVSWSLRPRDKGSSSAAVLRLVTHSLCQTPVRQIRNASRGLNAGNLPRVAGKDNSGSLILCEMQQALHLPARNHTCFINNQNPPAHCARWFLEASGSRARQSSHLGSRPFPVRPRHSRGRSHRKNLVSGRSLRPRSNFTERSSSCQCRQPLEH